MDHASLAADGAVGIVTVATLPDGCLDEARTNSLLKAVEQAEADPALRAIVLTGATPGYFVRHYSLNELALRGADMARRGVSVDPARPVPERPFHAMLRRIETMPKPVIAAVGGTAMGGGMELALACDLRIAQDGPFSLGLPEVNVGLLPGGGGTQRLPRTIGLGPAMELLLLGKTLSPAEALAYRLVAEVVPDAKARALDLARELARKPARALAHIKSLARRALERHIADGLAEERTLFADLVHRPEALAAMNACNDGRRDIRDR